MRCGIYLITEAILSFRGSNDGPIDPRCHYLEYRQGYIFNIYTIHLSIMTSFQISVRKDAYEKLKKAKRPGESFSDAILRILSSESNVQTFLDLYGTAENPEQGVFFEAFREEKRQLRESLNQRFGLKNKTTGADE